MTRGAALLVAVFCCLGVADDQGKPSVRASVCRNARCEQTAVSGFAPAIIRVSYSVPRHPENVGVGFGLVCSDFESISAWSLDGDRELIPSWLVTYRDVPAGTCRARAIVNRRDGSQLRGESGPVIIRGDD
jgi:hypothetical protein